MFDNAPGFLDDACDGDGEMVFGWEVRFISELLDGLVFILGGSL